MTKIVRKKSNRTDVMSVLNDRMKKESKSVGLDAIGLFSDVGGERLLGFNGKKFLFFGLVGLLGLFIIFGSFYMVEAGHRGVVLTFGEVDQLAKDEGLGVKVPFVQRVVVMSVQTQKYVADAGAASKDLQIVSTNLAVNYRLVPERIPEIFQEVGLGYEDRLIQPAVQEVVKASTAKFTAEALITERPLVKEEISSLLKERLSGRGIVIEEISITNFEFSEAFNLAIEQKVTAEQLKLKADRDLERIEVEAKQAKAQAEGFRDAQIAKAQGEAESIRIIEEELSKSPQYIEYYSLQRWDGVLPRVTGGALPFVDVGQFAGEGVR